MKKTAAELTKDNPDISARVQEKEVQKYEFATTADKILGLLQDEPIDVELKPGVVLSFYPPSDEQYIDLVCIRGEGVEYSKQLQNSGISEDINEEEAESKYPEVMGMVFRARDMLMKINYMLAELSVDKSFTPEKFKGLSMLYKQKILKALSDEHLKDIDAVRKFRKKR